MSSARRVPVQPSRLVRRIVLALALGLPAAAAAVDGISVTGHWSGTNENLYGGFGEIYRHDIEDGEVVGHTLLYQDAAQKARNPVISADGTRAAFLLENGRIAVVPLAGGDATVLQSAQSHGQACLDWPEGEWVYYTKGGFSQPSGSKLLHRVNAQNDVDEYVLTFKKNDGVTESGTWRFHIARDLQHTAIRPDDTDPHPAGCITAFDMINDGHLRSDRSLGARGDWRCSTGMDPDGVYIFEGNRAHTGGTVRFWDDLSEVKTMLWEDARSWGPDTADTGISHNRNAWAANSQKWLCIHVGWGNRGVNGANQMLINWVDEERIVVTENTDGSHAFDCAGDFFVVESIPDEPPEVLTQPADLTVTEGQPARFTVSARGTAPLRYRWQRDGADLGGEDTASLAFTAALTDDGARFRCVVSNDFGTATSDEAVLTVEPDTQPNEPPLVDAGPDSSVRVNADLLLSGTVTDDGRPGSGLTIAWSQLSGPGAVVLTTPDAASTYATFDAEGEYELRLQADDGELSAHDDVHVTVNPLPWIRITRPAGGESWEADSVQNIEWQAYDVTNVRIDYSVDGGDTWISVEESVDATEHPQWWTSYPWTVPETPTAEARIKLNEYSWVTSDTSELFTIVGPPQTLELLSPAAGDTLTGDSTTQVRWTAENVDRVVLEYTLVGGDAWSSIGETDATLGEQGWLVPSVSTSLAEVRARTVSGNLADRSGPFTIVPGAQPAGALEVTRLTVTGELPAELGAIGEVLVDGEAVAVGPDRVFTAEKSVPAGAESLVLTIRAGQGADEITRTLRLDLEDGEPPIDGLPVSAAEIREFLGGRDAALVWVDAGSRMRVLDLREADPAVRLLADDLDCVNPLISPDGTRVVYSRGMANGPKTVYLRALDGSGAAERIGGGDIGYWHLDAGGDEHVVYCDWSVKQDNGAGGSTHLRAIERGGVVPAGDPQAIHDRAMDAGPNADLTWLGQVYDNLWAHDLGAAADYPTASFFLLDGSPADHQSCNGSMAPDSTARLMALVIPHDWVRIYTHDPGTDTIRETTRFALPRGMVEWEFPEWSTDPDYFTAALHAGDQNLRLFVLRVAEGEVVPERIQITGDHARVTYSHLWVGE